MVLGIERDSVGQIVYIVKPMATQTRYDYDIAQAIEYLPHRSVLCCKTCESYISFIVSNEYDIGKTFLAQCYRILELAPHIAALRASDIALNITVEDDYLNGAILDWLPEHALHQLVIYDAQAQERSISYMIAKYTT